MTITFYTFTMGDVDDVDIYAAQPIWEWQQTDHGRWVMEHAQDLKYCTSSDAATLGHRIAIRGTLPEGPLVTEYFLRFQQ